MNNDMRAREHRLTPEEDAIGDPDEMDGEIDDLLPSDLWYRFYSRRNPASRNVKGESS